MTTQEGRAGRGLLPPPSPALTAAAGGWACCSARCCSAGPACSTGAHPGAPEGHRRSWAAGGRGRLKRRRVGTGGAPRPYLSDNTQDSPDPL